MRNPLRRVSALILGTAVAVALAACSSDDSGDAAEASGDAAFPVTVETKTGTVEIPEKPENIVALSSGAVESVLAVGETPVASLLSDAEAEKPFLTPYADDINRDTGLGTGASDLHIEKIASVSPDLIIAPAWPSYTDPAVADKLEAIAPTLFFDNNVNQSDWETGFAQVADAVGQSEAARTFLDGVDGERAQGAEKLANIKGRSYSFGTPYSGGVWLTSSARGVLADLGLEPADGDQKKLTEAADNGDAEGAMVQLAPEEIRRAAADFVILAQFKEVADELRENPLFDGVLKDHMVWTDAADAINNAGPLGNRWVFETLPDEILNSDAYAHVTR